MSDKAIAEVIERLEVDRATYERLMNEAIARTQYRPYAHASADYLRGLYEGTRRALITLEEFQS